MDLSSPQVDLEGPQLLIVHPVFTQRRIYLIMIYFPGSWNLLVVLHHWLPSCYDTEHILDSEPSKYSGIYISVNHDLHCTQYLNSDQVCNSRLVGIQKPLIAERRTLASPVLHHSSTPDQVKHLFRYKTIGPQMRQIALLAAETSQSTTKRINDMSEYCDQAQGH